MMPLLPTEIRSQYRAKKQFEAYLFDENAYALGDEDYGVDEVTISNAADLFADTNAWTGLKWRGEEIVSFFSGLSRYYASNAVFTDSTDPIS
jgi:hypothetical protein